MYEYLSYTNGVGSENHDPFALPGIYSNDFKAIADCFVAIGKFGPKQVTEFLDYHFTVFERKYPGLELAFIEFIKDRIQAGFEEKGTGAPISRIFRRRIDEWIEQALQKVPPVEIEEYNQANGAVTNQAPIELRNESKSEFHPNTNQSQNTNSIGRQKLKWKCTPAVAGFIISELFRAGYIECPITHGEPSFNKLAELCMDIFHVTGKDGSTTLGYWKKVVNPDQNQLIHTKRAKLKIPDLSELE